MEVTIQGTPKEIAALVLAVQGRQLDDSAEDVAKQIIENLPHLCDSIITAIQTAGVTANHGIPSTHP